MRVHVFVRVGESRQGVCGLTGIILSSAWVQNLHRDRVSIGWILYQEMAERNRGSGERDDSTPDLAGGAVLQQSGR